VVIAVRTPRDGERRRPLPRLAETSAYAGYDGDSKSQYTRSQSLAATLEAICSLIVNAYHDALMLKQTHPDADHAELVINLDLAARLAHRAKEEVAA
jgi:hypothetical protein